MRIRVDFTIDVPPESMDALRELAGEGSDGSVTELRGYVRGEAEDYIYAYLEGNGVGFSRVRSVYGPMAMRSVTA